jgi:hypothetical protein
VGKKLLPVNGKVDELRKLLASKKIGSRCVFIPFFAINLTYHPLYF